jgi:hypothetical protein
MTFTLSSSTTPTTSSSATPTPSATPPPSLNSQHAAASKGGGRGRGKPALQGTGILSLPALLVQKYKYGHLRGRGKPALQGTGTQFIFFPFFSYPAAHAQQPACCSFKGGDGGNPLRKALVLSLPALLVQKYKYGHLRRCVPGGATGATAMSPALSYSSVLALLVQKYKY